MKASPDLFELIKSLTKSEKRYFKLSVSVQQGEKNYTKLFDAIDKQEVYDEEELKTIFRKETFARNLAYEKHYLYNLIIKSITPLHVSSSASGQIKEMLKTISLLFDKALYSQCKKMVIRTKKLAYSYEKFTLLLEIINWERKLANIYRGDFAEKLKNHASEVETLLLRISQTYDYLKLFDKILSLQFSMGHFRNKIEFDEIQKVMRSPLLKTQDKAVSVTEKYLYNSIHAAYANQSSDLTNSYIYNNACAELLEAHPLIVKDDPDKYISILNSLHISCINLHKYTEAGGIVKKMKSIEKDFDLILSSAMKIRVFLLSASRQLTVYIETGEFIKGVADIGEIEDFIQLHANKSYNIRKKIIYLYFTIICLGASKYKKALQYIALLKNEHTLEMSEGDLSTVFILNLIIHYELDNYDTLPYLVKSAYRHFYKHKTLYGFEAAILDFMKKLIRTNSTKQLLSEFENLRADLQRLKKKNVLEVDWVKGFDIISWLESKIEKRPFGEIVKEKVHNRL